jgi:hypothetical protein
MENVVLSYRLLTAYADVVDGVLAADPALIPEDLMAMAQAAKAITDEHVL